MTLLAPDEPAALRVEQTDGTSAFLLTCDHASRRIPRALGTLGLSEAELATHIAWDIGAANVARYLADELGATLVLQNYSRLVIDCNRPNTAPDSIPVKSEATRIPGNENLAEAQIAARRAEIFAPYHDGLRAIIDQRLSEQRPTLLVAIHSFTPSYHGVARPWHVGLMHRRDTHLAPTLFKLLCQDHGLRVGDNEPYAITDQTDYSLPVHGEARGLPHVGIEIRQDLVGEECGQKTWAERLARLLQESK
jgi:predicted N-formylglutamate amidohydrolase